MLDHPSYAGVFNHYLSLLTILGLVFLAIVAARLSYLIIMKKRCPVAPFLDTYVLPLGFFVTLLGIGLSLFYSQVLLYTPCDLCWYQRVFLYPQVFIFAYAWYKKDKAVLPYTLVLSFIGALIALYHHFLQIGFDLMKPCSTAPFAVDCAKPSFIEFGFVTFPLMSFVLFGFICAAIFISGRFKK